MYLSDIKIVDLRLSEWNKETSDPKEGNYDFTNKVYIDYYGDQEARPEYYFCWCRYDSRNNYRELRDYKIMWQYSTVNVDTDLFWPEGVPPDENGNYNFGDVILVKRDLIAQLKDKLEKRERSRGAGRAKLQEFQSKMEKYGAGIPASMVKEIMGG